MLKTCLTCKKTFEKEYNAQKYCSDECKQIGHNQRNKGLDLICLNCNKNFVGNKSNKFCSSECKGEHRKNNFKLFACKCDKCGKSFESSVDNAKFCSNKCRLKDYHEQKKYKGVCVVCGNDFETSYKQQKSCSVECANKARTVQPLVTCEHCGKEFRRHKNYGGRYCSRKCSFEHTKTKENAVCECCGETFEKYPERKSNLCYSCFQNERDKRREEKQKESEEIKQKQCVTCQKLFNPENMQQKYCSDECNPWIKSGKELEQYKATLEKECVTCGQSFTAAKPNSRYCSSKCRRKATNRKNEIRKGKRGELILSNGNVDVDISLEKLMQRDNNTCYLCGGECDNSDYTVTDEGHYITGYYHPTIDHVIAIANGGTHTWDNIRLAHMICNSVKSDKVIV